MDIADLSALMGEDLSQHAGADIWVVARHLASEGSGGGALLLGEARRLADGLGCYVHAVVESDAEAALAFEWGADQAYVTADMGAYLADQHPEFILAAAEDEALLARLAQRFDAGLITRAVGGLEIDPETRSLRGRHSVYQGEYYLEIEVTSNVKAATVETATLPAAAKMAGREGEITVSDLAAPEAGLRDLGPATDFVPPVWRPLSKARTIVSVGRGIGGAEAVALARELASRLGAEFAGDRSARDSGWVDAAHEVGVTGQEVAPDLYLALGILGDTVHNAAIAGARRVVAVHANPNAPIFGAADEAVAAEPSEVIQALLRTL